LVFSIEHDRWIGTTRSVFADPRFASDDRRLGSATVAESALLGLLPRTPSTANDSAWTTYLPARPSDHTSMTSAAIGFASETPEICYRAFPELLLSKACRKGVGPRDGTGALEDMSCRVCSHRRRTIALCAEQSLRFRCLSGADRPERGR